MNLAFEGKQWFKGGGGSGGWEQTVAPCYRA